MAQTNFYHVKIAGQVGYRATTYAINDYDNTVEGRVVKAALRELLRLRKTEKYITGLNFAKDGVSLEINKCKSLYD